MPYLTVDGRKVHFVQREPVPSRQPPVVFLHGAGGNHQHWLYQVRDLAPWSSYALDLPGHGRSEGPGRDRIETYGDVVAGFLDAAGLDRVVLVGHSMGGAIAQDVALRYPARVAGLGLVATGARLRVAPALLEGIRQDPEAALDLICRWAFGPEASEDLVRLGRRQMARVPPGVLYDDFAACDVFNLTDRVAGIEASAFALCGTRDRMTPVKYSVYLRDQITGSTLHLVEGAGHMVMLEKPGAVVSAAKALLERL